jgi:hypothetical protein
MGEMGMGSSFFIAPDIRLALHSCRTSDGGLWVLILGIVGKRNDEGWARKRAFHLFEAGFLLMNDFFGKRPAERKKSGPRLFLAVVMCCCCCCCVCNTKIPQTIDLSSLLDIKHPKLLGWLYLGFLHFMDGNQKEMTINIKKKTMLLLTLFFDVCLSTYSQMIIDDSQVGVLLCCIAADSLSSSSSPSPS